MSAHAPHYLLFSESRRRSAGAPASDWRFVLQSLDGTSRLEAADAEPELGCERLELLAVVRGLEALEQPSQVTLVTPSKYVARGLSYGLADWRENDWNWENHGQMVPIKNRDLWQRLDRALAFHQVQCRTTIVAELEGDSPPLEAVRKIRRIDSAHASEPCGDCVPQPHAHAKTWAWHPKPSAAGLRPGMRQVAAFFSRLIAAFRRWLEHWSELESPTRRWRIS
jgi:ribonuclease HI